MTLVGDDAFRYGRSMIFVVVNCNLLSEVAYISCCPILYIHRGNLEEM